MAGLAVISAVVAGIASRNKVAGVFEGLFYGAIAFYGGCLAGALLALIAPIWFTGIWMLFMALASIFLGIRGMVVGGGGIGFKVLGLLLTLLLSGGLAVVGAYAWVVLAGDVPGSSYLVFVAASALACAFCAWLHAMLAASYGAYHGAFGWLLILLDSTWSILGTVAGAIHHLASWSQFSQHGDPEYEKRSFYVKYRDGIRFKSGFAFTLGAVMSSPPVERHESNHVIQHYIFGSLFTVSYIVWMALIFLFALVAGAITRKPAVAIEAWCYYNNPWEVWAYAIEGSRSVNRDTSLIWGPVLSWIVAVTYYVAAVTAAIVWIVIRHGS
jgi:hypothetical protein